MIKKKIHKTNHKTVDLKYSFEIRSSIALLNLSGKILSDEEHIELMDFIKDKIEDNTRKFVIDIKNLTYINSSGLNLLLKLFTSIRNKGGEMAIINPNKVISELFKISKLDTVFSIQKDEESAIKYLNITKE